MPASHWRQVTATLMRRMCKSHGVHPLQIWRLECKSSVRGSRHSQVSAHSVSALSVSYMVAKLLWVCDFTVSRSSDTGLALCRSCRARLDLHNNRRRKRGESGSETYRSSARLERRLGEQLHQRISTRSRSRRSARKPRSDSSDVSLPGFFKHPLSPHESEPTSVSSCTGASASAPAPAPGASPGSPAATPLM